MIGTMPAMKGEFKKPPVAGSRKRPFDGMTVKAMTKI